MVRNVYIYDINDPSTFLEGLKKNRRKFGGVGGGKTAQRGEKAIFSLTTPFARPSRGRF
jgi:hypothetical protein